MAVRFPLVLALLVPLIAAASPTPVPVMIGSEPELDACPALAAVAGLRRDGDGFLAVRAGPGTGYEQVDTFHEGDEFFVCTTSADGKWFGIVYPPVNSKDIDCGIGSPVPSPRAYAGPCRSGWVHSNWVRVIAG